MTGKGLRLCRSKAETAPIGEVLKPVAKRPDKNQRRERWLKELGVEQEVIEPEEAKANPESGEFSHPFLASRLSQIGNC